jgi:hypothetical protein
MATKRANLFGRVFKSKDGKVIVWQKPNLLLWGWILCWPLAMVIRHDAAHRGIQHIGSAALFAWAYLEIRSGDSLFRRILGGVVLGITIYGFFRA